MIMDTLNTHLVAVALTDMTPVDYLKMRRLEQAATLLRRIAKRVCLTMNSIL